MKITGKCVNVELSKQERESVVIVKDILGQLYDTIPDEADISDIEITYDTLRNILYNMLPNFNITTPGFDEN